MIFRIIWTDVSSVLSQSMRLTDRPTDTFLSLNASPRWHSMHRGKKLTLFLTLLLASFLSLNIVAAGPGGKRPDSKYLTELPHWTTIQYCNMVSVYYSCTRGFTVTPYTLRYVVRMLRARADCMCPQSTSLSNCQLPVPTTTAARSQPRPSSI